MTSCQRQIRIGNSRSPHDTAVGGVKHVRSRELALAANTASRAENLDISRPNVKHTKVQGNGKHKSTGKREAATPRSGQGLAGDTTSCQCNNCAKLLGQTFLRCVCCKLVGYCNNTCQGAHWSQHKTLHNAITKEIYKKKLDCAR